MKKIVKDQGKEEGGSWDCYNAHKFYGWEANSVVAATTGAGNILEMLTRAKTRLIVILAEPEEKDEVEDWKGYYAVYQKYF